MILVFKWLLGHWQAIAISIAIAGLLGAGYYIKSVIAQNAAMKIEMKQKDAEILNIKNRLDTVVSSVVKQNEDITKLHVEMNRADTEAKEAMQIFVTHNLAGLSAAKPGLIEKRVNKATQAVFADMQRDTVTFYQEVTN